MTTTRRTRRPVSPSREQAKRAVIYVRMSMDRTGEGAGLERQEEACRALALARGWDVAQVVTDTVSATKVRMADRPGWTDVVRLVEAGEVEVVIAWHMDRITRDMDDLSELIKLAQAHGVGIATATGDIDLTNDTGRMVARILGAVAAAEGERKAARQVLANEQRANAGRPMWVRRPFGYERDGSLREVEAAVVRKGYADFLNGRPLSAIARDFTASGLPTTTGNATWGIATVRTILRSARNCAKATYYGEVVADATWEPIVDESTWRAVERLLSDPARHRGQGPLANLLSGIAVCDVCEATVKVNWRGRKGAEGSYATYVCSAHGHATLPVDFLDGRVLLELTRRAGELGHAAFAVEDTPDLAPMRAEEAKLSERLDELAESFAAGEISRRQLSTATAKLSSALDDVTARIAAAGRSQVWDTVDVEHLFEEFDGLALETQRAVVKAACERIAVKPRGKGRIAPSAEYVEIEWSPEWRTVRRRKAGAKR